MDLWRTLSHSSKTGYYRCDNIMIMIDVLYSSLRPPLLLSLKQLLLLLHSIGMGLCGGWSGLVVGWWWVLSRHGAAIVLIHLLPTVTGTALYELSSALFTH